ncbi:RNA polymerase sigma factor SigJ [Microbacterium sp. NPDC055903]
MDEVLERERRSMMALGYRLLGTVADAEDAVQETYVRWYRLSEDERMAIRNPAAWLTRVAGRVCLDMLGSARARREKYVGEWLPEPVPGDWAAPASVDPLDRVAQDESVGMALMVILDALTPAERVAFVLHDVFGVPFAEVAQTIGRSADAARQLASQARRRVGERRAGLATRAQHDAVALAFAEAAETGELDRLVELLDPDVVLRSDGGGKVSAARKPVLGADRVGRFLLGIPRLEPRLMLSPVVAGDGIAFLGTVDGRADSLVSLVVDGDRITEVQIVRNPDKLTLWR